MKKSILVALLMLLLLAMVGCGGGSAPTPDQDADESLGWRSQEDQMAYMPDLLTLSEFLSVDEPVLFFWQMK